jgi:hypothetical protein
LPSALRGWLVVLALSALACSGSEDSATEEPLCGDAVVNLASERCDGSDDVACPGACLPDCTCGPRCGDGTVDPVEECDGADDASCPAHCRDDCTCGPFCGDGHVDAGEECDGSEDRSCPGHCLADCTCESFCGDGIVDEGEQCDGQEFMAFCGQIENVQCGGPAESLPCQCCIPLGGSFNGGGNQPPCCGGSSCIQISSTFCVCCKTAGSSCTSDTECCSSVCTAEQNRCSMICIPGTDRCF